MPLKGRILDFFPDLTTRLLYLSHTPLKQEPMPVWKLHISQLGASSWPGKNKVAGQVLSRF